MGKLKMSHCGQVLTDMTCEAWPHGSIIISAAAVYRRAPSERITVKPMSQEIVLIGGCADGRVVPFRGGSLYRAKSASREICPIFSPDGTKQLKNVLLEDRYHLLLFEYNGSCVMAYVEDSISDRDVPDLWPKYARGMPESKRHRVTDSADRVPTYASQAMLESCQQENASGPDEFHERATEIIHAIQTKILGVQPTPVLVMDNPRQALLTACILVWRKIGNARSNWERFAKSAGVANLQDVENAIDRQLSFQKGYNPLPNMHNLPGECWDDSLLDASILFQKILTSIEPITKSQPQSAEAFNLHGDFFRDFSRGALRSALKNEFTVLERYLWPNFINSSKSHTQEDILQWGMARIEAWLWMEYLRGETPYQFTTSHSSDNHYGLLKLQDECRDQWPLLEVAQAALGDFIFLQNACVVSRKPTAVHMNELGFHCENGMAVEYEGWGIYSLNGIQVPEYLVMTPSEDLCLNWYHQQENADVRTEFVRKYGVERMLSLGKKIDSFEYYEEAWWTASGYELWDMAILFPGLEYQPYLKMMNQTTGIWHVEAVSPDCMTLPQAIRERLGGRDFTIRAIA